MVRFRVELPDPLTLPDENEAVTPTGIPLAVRLTTPLNPFSAPTAIVEPPAPPSATVTDAGDADREKSGAATFKFTVVLIVELLLAPNTLME